MIFIDNKYTRWYYSIIRNAQSRVIEGYTEKHHIIPKSCGGSNSKDNLVALTAREHFICHLLLTKMTTGVYKSKMVHTSWMMMNIKKYGYNRSSKLYETARLARSKWISTNRTGTNHPMFNKPITDEHRQNLRNGAKNRPKPSAEIIEKRRVAQLGLKRTDETRKNLSIAWQKKEKLTCVHCGIVCPPHLHNRWHGNNCKHQIVDL